MAVSPLTEMALSLSSVVVGVLVMKTAAGSENLRDSAAMAVSPPAGMYIYYINNSLISKLIIQNTLLFSH